MDHIAIMKKSWGLTEKILTGEKKIESRWYKNKAAPWGKIKEGDTVYFKNSGEPVTIKADIVKILEFSDLNPSRVREILDKYGAEDGIEPERTDYFFKLFKDKRYCLLVFLKNSVRVKPFHINKADFGAMAAWITTDSIRELRI